VDTDEELNPVLAGYFCKVMQVLVGNKPREVFKYIYEHQVVLSNLVKHIYQKSISDVLVRILNVSDNMLEDPLESDLNKIKESFIRMIVDRLGPDFTFEDNLNAQSLLSELAEQQALFEAMTAQESLEKYLVFIQSGSESSQKNTLAFLTNLVPKSQQNFNKKGLPGFCQSEFMDFEETAQNDDMTVVEGLADSDFFQLIKKVAEHMLPLLDLEKQQKGPEVETQFAPN